MRSALLSTSDTSEPSMELVLDGHLRVFRVLPSGLSSMISTGGRWSVGDYAVELSSGGETLYLDLFAFAEGREAARDDDDAGVATRRVSLSMRLEQAFSARDAAGVARSSDVTLSVQGTSNSSVWVVYRSFYGRRAIAWLLKLQKRQNFATGTGKLTVDE
ncbi:hypothetical protein PR001_g17287 [Phytophthora rubi]|uniref:Uncharacterized protein n=1 Tax=Phytophthora rubi TaxID=129364 RepID=A0A6A3KKU1_9STRA|nr:hypothetical protein PR001_g17287 [Phytophthora rubi]